MSRWHLVLLLLACWFASAAAALAWQRQARELDATAMAAGAQAGALQQGAGQLAAELAAAHRLTGPAADRAAHAAAVMLHPAAQAAQVLGLLRGAEATYGVRWRTLTLGHAGAAAALANPSAGAVPGAGGGLANASTGSGTAATSGLSASFPPVGAAAAGARTFDSLFVESTALPGMRVATLSAAGEYRSLAQMQALLDALIGAGAALTELTLEDDRIQLTATLINLHR